MPNVDQVRDFRFRRLVGAPDLRRLDGSAEEEADLEYASLRTDEEVARLAREHDRAMRGVDPLLAELHGRLAKALPGLSEIVREIARERGFGGRPAVVHLAGSDPGLAVVALVAAGTGPR